MSTELKATVFSEQAASASAVTNSAVIWMMRVMNVTSYFLGAVAKIFASSAFHHLACPVVPWPAVSGLAGTK